MIEQGKRTETFGSPAPTLLVSGHKQVLRLGQSPHKFTRDDVHQWVWSNV